MRFLLMTLLAVTTGFSLPASAREPLIMDGKDTLFERVLIRDTASGYDAPEGNIIGSLLPLQPFYVYARDGDWMQVGASDKGEDLFWMEAKSGTVWRQNIVATFEGSESLGRVLFFRDIDSVYEVIESEQPDIPATEFRDQALAAETSGEPAEDIVALGPRATPDLRRNLYVMPILENELAQMEANRSDVNILKVAVVRAGADGDNAASNVPIPIPDVDREDYRAGIVFVVDTTISMAPYIKGTEAALKSVYQAFADEGIEDAVSFGLIGYRDSLEAAPQLGYDVRTFVNLQEGRDRENFFAAIDTMFQADDPSRHFREDAFMGINHAIETMDWADFGARYIILITDASPRPASDKHSATGLTPGAMNTLVQERLRGITSVLHLKTERGKKDHSIAESAYRELVRRDNLDSLYRPIENGDQVEFIEAAKSIASVAVRQVLDFRAGITPIEPDESTVTSNDEDAFTASLTSAGRTMQLAFLGRQAGTKAPDVFEAFVADRDFDRVGLKPLSIRLLLNKSALSDLSESMQIIFEKGDENILTPDQMFTQILSAAAEMTRRQENVAGSADTTLAEAASISELLEGLPYQSNIMGLTEDDWINLGFSEQQVRLTELSDKIELYSRLNESTDLWVDYLGQGTGADALVYPMKLNDLP